MTFRRLRAQRTGLSPAASTGVRKVTGRAAWTTKRTLASRALALAARLNDRIYVGLDYPTSTVNGPRYGHGRPPHPELEQILRGHDEAYRRVLRIILRHAYDLRMIERHAPDPVEPSWINDMLPALTRPRSTRSSVSGAHAATEIGSGNSTKFAREPSVTASSQRS
jgi:hypothetical protein